MFNTSKTLRHLTRLVLAWYVLFVGVSVLASTLQPRTMDVVCSSMGIMKVVVQGEGGDAQVRSTMDCSLCAHATPALPPTTVAVLAHVPDARSHIVQRLPESVLIARTAPPFSSRGLPERPVLPKKRSHWPDSFERHVCRHAGQCVCDRQAGDVEIGSRAKLRGSTP